jgi:hypothetical protein
VPLLRVRDPRAKLGQRHPAVPVSRAVHAVHDPPASRGGALQARGSPQAGPRPHSPRPRAGHAPSSPRPSSRATPPCRPDNAVGESQANHMSILGLRPPRVHALILDSSLRGVRGYRVLVVLICDLEDSGSSSTKANSLRVDPPPSREQWT